MAHSKDDILEDRSRRGYKNVKNSRKIENIHRMGLSILQRLESLRKRNSDNRNAVNKDLYRMVCNKELLNVSYNLIKSNPENVAPGTDIETLEKIVELKIGSIVDQLRNKTFLFNPVRRVYISKDNPGKTKPLKLAFPRAKIVKKAIALIMENIYEPTFATHNHGFRPGKNCHTALREFRKEWGGIKWVMKGKIAGCYENIDHYTLTKILRRKIKDEHFIQLIWKLIQPGVEKNKGLEKTQTGTPEEEMLYHILSNIYLHELDKYLLATSHEMSIANNVSSKRMNTDYKNIQYKIYSLKTEIIKKKTIKATLTEDRIKKLTKKLRTIASKAPMDPEYKKLLFIRYADKWIIGIIGEKEEATKLRTKVENYLKDHLKLRLSTEKSKITYIKKRVVQFLGYELHTVRISKLSKSKTQPKRVGEGQPRICMPASSIIRKMVDNSFCSNLGTGVRKKEWVHYPDKNVIKKFNYIIRGLRNYYSPADNFRTGITRIKYILKFACAHTIASKRRTRVSTQMKRWKELELDSQEKPSNLKVSAIDYNADFIAYPKKNNLLPSLKCVACASNEHLEMHHVKDFRKNKVDHVDKHATEIMQRNQICVCRICHTAIQNGNYDTKNLAFL
jgi:group II intron reverse transcriptase/maturase